MAYFSQGQGRLKLMLLYFLKEMDLALTKNQIYTVFAENNWMEFFDFQTALLQLEEDEQIMGDSYPFGRGYRVTPLGLNTLDLFLEELPHSIREDILLYAQQNRELLLSGAQFSSIKTKLPDGGWLVVLRLMDNNDSIMDMSLRLPNSALADNALKNWPNEAQALYQQVINSLINKAQ